ncbi:MAG: XDD3 family exosortase-dependent surface protein [Hormoscilla sp.]
MNKLQQKSNRRFYTLLSQGTVAALGLLAIAGSPAEASSMISGNFSLFLECNNDIIIQTFDPNSSAASGWHYTDDAKGDNTDGFLYDILGMATKETKTGDVVVVLNSNVPLEGTGFDKQTNPVMFGDLFFSSGDAGQSFTEAMESGKLFGIHFAENNEAKVDDAGVYSQVIAKGVGVNNFGHKNYQNYMDLVDDTLDNFWGDLDNPDPYLNVTGPGYNVIAQGNKVKDDGFELLDMDNLLLAGFDKDEFDNIGTELIAFKFNKEALAYQPTLQEQAADLGVPWKPEWDEEFATIDAEKTHLRELKKEKNATVAAEREKIGYLQEAWERKDANSTLKRNKEKLSAAKPVLAYLQDKKEKWDAMSPAQQANAASEDEWTRKDEKDLSFQTRKTQQYEDENASILATYTEEELDNGAADFKTKNKEAKKNYPDYKDALDDSNAVSKLLKENKQEKEDLENEISEILLAARKEQVEEVVAAAEEIEQQLETERGGPRTSADSGGIPTLPEGTTPMVSVPESSSTVGLVVLGLGLVGSQLRKRR